MKKIMISVAPVAATDILINPRAIARDVYECYKNGASMVHLHCRDLNGNLTPDLSLLEETVAYIREMCDIVVEISTGGVSNLTIEERVQPCYPSWVEANSLNVGSGNLGTSGPVFIFRKLLESFSNFFVIISLLCNYQIIIHSRLICVTLYRTKVRILECCFTLN